MDGIDNNLGYAISSKGVWNILSGEKWKFATSLASACSQKFQRSSRVQEALEERPWVVKTNVGIEKDKEYNWIECIDTTLQIVPEIDRSTFWRVFELLEDERMAMKFAARKWLLRKVWQDTENGSDLGLAFDSVAQPVTPQVKKRKRKVNV